MRMSVSRCQQEVNSADFSELIAYNNISPFMIDRAEYMIANLCALTANIHAKKKTFKADDFLLQTKSKKQTPEQMEKTLGALYGFN